MKNKIDSPGKRSRSIAEAKPHYRELKKPILRYESRLLPILGFYLNLPVRSVDS